ncbi:MAG: hypothetical protein CL928_15100 [Deltaproteobacteria bacterium]|nr:hypothetical protein [Deltaproteobacteria bacterium]
MSALLSALKVVEGLHLDGEEDWVLRATLKALIRGYDFMWHGVNKHYDVRACEVALAAPLYNLKNGKARRSHHIAGKIDKIVQHNPETPGFLTIFDHKTTSSDISPESSYWRQLSVDTQPKHYMFLARTAGYPVGRVVWDAVRKPGLKPKALTKANWREAVEEGTYLGEGISPAAIGACASALKKENEELFSIRVQKKILEDPGKHFQRRPVTPLMQDLVDHTENMVDVSYDMATARKRYRNTGRVVKNSGACMMYNTPCKFLGVCSGQSSLLDEGWKNREHKFPELPEFEGVHDDRTVLTHSRVRCFQTCPAKHQYQYEDGYYRAQEDTSQALYFGTVWHEMMDAWWTAWNSGSEKGGADE